MSRYLTWLHVMQEGESLYEQHCPDRSTAHVCHEGLRRSIGGTLSAAASSSSGHSVSQLHAQCDRLCELLAGETPTGVFVRSHRTSATSAAGAISARLRDRDAFIDDPFWSELRPPSPILRQDAADISTQ